MEYHRDDRYISEIEVLLVLDRGPADAQFHEGHSQGPYPQPHILITRMRRQCVPGLPSALKAWLRG